MSIDNSTRNKIESFAHAVVEEPDGANTEGVRGTYVLRTPGFSEISTNAFALNTDDITGHISLWGKPADLYLETLDALRLDSAVDRLTPAQLQDDFDNFTIELLSVRNTQASNQHAATRLMRAFIERISQPLDGYEVVFGIDNITLGSNSFSIGNVEFRTFESAYAQEWCENSLDEILPNVIYNALIGQSIGLVKVEAGTYQKAIERSSEEIDHALNVLRVAIGSHRPGLIYDFQLMQKRKNHYLAKEICSNGVEVGTRFDTDAMCIDFSGALADSTKEFLNELDSLNDGTIQGRLKDALLRSLAWVGTSITREEHDHKIVDLCTALESALTTKDDRSKGEAIALRMMLLSMALGKMFPRPRTLYEFYEKRSNVVHGSKLGECGESDYRTLRTTTETVILNILDLLGREPNITTPFKLIGHLQSHDRLKEAICWLICWQDKGTTEIAKYALRKRSELVSNQD